jgi:DNA-binding PadR family transcriptional regulator
MLRHALLGLLARQGRHGYELKNALEQALGGSWEINFGQIYSTLGRLERDGLVNAVAVQSDGRGKKTYELTELGRQELEGWFDQPVEKSRRLRDEFFVKLVVRHLSGYGDALEMIARQRKAYLQRVRDLTRLAAHTPDDPFVSLLIEGAILHLQADLRWLDLCDERLEQLKNGQ